jgi:hypothetical protein
MVVKLLGARMADVSQSAAKLVKRRWREIERMAQK